MPYRFRGLGGVSHVCSMLEFGEYTKNFEPLAAL